MHGHSNGHSNGHSAAAEYNIRVGVIGGSGLYKLEGIEVVKQITLETVSRSRMQP